MDKIQQIRDSIDSVIERAKQRAIAEINGELLQRIFREGKDKNDQNIGTYKPSTANIRKNKGLQTSVVDLTFSTKLNKSIMFNDKQIYFSNEYGVNISQYNENNFNKRIFAPTETEKEIFVRVLNEEMADLIKQ